MLRRLYNWVMHLAGHRHAPWYLAVISFAEASFFPAPPDLMLAPMVAARPEKAWTYAGICSAASVLGACLGYAIGLFLTGLAVKLLTLFGHPNALAEFQHQYDTFGTWVILIKGLTPIPFKLVTIASGLAHFNFAMFVLLCAITRSARFFIEAALLKRFGPAILPAVEKRLGLFTVVVLAIIISGFVVLRYL